MLSDVPPLEDLQEQRAGFEKSVKKVNKILGLSREEIEISLIQTKLATETLSIVNRHSKKVNILVKLS